VISGGALFIGGLNGVMYALDAAYDAQGGSPRILWSRDMGSPVRTGAGISDDVVIVGTQHGAIYGMNTSNGSIRWTIQTGGAILAAPLIANGIAYLGSADGSFYAIRANDGALIWQQPLGAPILASAALSDDGKAVFVAAENMVAYAISASQGGIMWQAPLQGQSSADRWPVVQGDTVVFRTQPLRNFHPLLQDGDKVMDRAGSVRGDWNTDWSAVKPQIVQYLNQVPYDQTLFALNTNDGQSRGTAPVLYTFGTNDPPAAPVAANGSFYLPYRARHGIQTDSPVGVHVTTKYDAELGQMDPKTLDIGAVGSGATSAAFGYQFRLTSDEPAVLTMSGNLLLVDSWERLGGINLSNGSLVGIASMSSSGECNWGAAPNPLQFYESCPQFPVAVPNGEGNTRVGAAVGAGRIFWRVNSALCAIGPANGVPNVVQNLPTRSTAEPALSGANRLSGSTLASYVWDIPATKTTVPDDLRQRLENEVSKVVSVDAHLMPFYLERGFHGKGSWPPDVTNDSEPAILGNSNTYWYDQGEMIVSLAKAYPYVNPGLQASLKNYLDAEMQRFAPLSRLPWPVDSWFKQGRARELYSVPIRNGLVVWPPPGVPIQTLYAMWAYSYYTNDWRYVTEHWSEVDSLFDNKKGSIDSYAEISGAIGYARIAKQLGKNGEAGEGEAVALAAMQRGYDFGSWLKIANQRFPDDKQSGWSPAQAQGRRGAVFFGMTPEVGHYLRDSNSGSVAAVLDDIAGYPFGAYMWYVTRLGLQSELQEGSYHTPELAWSVFLAKAYIEGANQSQLRYWLDRPWGIGDVWYLQKVVAAIEASS
jgi:hypothetical protein